jgi:WXXGXW repeat (2 copies)
MSIVQKFFRVSTATLGTSLLLLSTLHAKDIYADSAPPTPKAEHSPGPRDGYIWGQGHWEWSGKAYFWVAGNWVTQRHGMRFIPDHWDPEGDKWHFVPSHWEHQ